ncbi:MAG: TonB-dependent receptor plug domain-containing protein [Bacteroidales bacterium]|nr:TonB-dependent receptor plug domain-containing protein [Bacteroidales bacterium]
MKSIKKFLLITLAILMANTIYSQKVTGVVKVQKPNGSVEPISYASIYWLEEQEVFESNEKGLFSFDRRERDEVSLVATFVGHTQDTVVLSKDNNVAEFIIKEGAELEAARIITRQQGNYISKLSSVKTEVISAAGLCKMACCSLAESFENSASVTVGYSDAITGAKQIRLLGLSGIYTQMLDENRPIMRGIASPFGLSYIPGQWLESIQIAKGPSSVINGLEAISGQINMEHRKPTTEQPLFVNLFLSSSLRKEANVASSIQLNNKWSTVVLGHFSNAPGDHDGNDDGFRDDPRTTQYNLSNRWLYMAENGAQLRFGFKALKDDRLAGQIDFNEDAQRDTQSWGSNIKNSGFNGYVKFGIPLTPSNSKNIAAVLDYAYHELDSYFGLKEYKANQNSLFANLIYQNELNENHKYSLGFNARADQIEEHLKDYFRAEFYDFYPDRNEGAIGGYGEYTYTNGEKVSVVAGFRLDYNNIYGWLPAPRINLKYAFDPRLIFRALGGRGFRSAYIIPDNMGILSTGRRIESWGELDIEDAWTYGANLTAYLPFGYEDASLSFDYFRSDFNKQVIVDQEYDLSKISVYNLDGRSFTNTYQIDFNLEPIERLTLLATFRYTDAKTTLKGQGLVEKPLTSRYKGVFNIQYATRMNIWTFDFTAQLNGPSRIPDFAGGGNSPVYTMLFAQVTKKFRDLELYVGAENLTNYKQENPIIDAQNAYSENFNASIIWGPLMGTKVYAGLRYTLWK